MLTVKKADVKKAAQAAGVAEVKHAAYNKIMKELAVGSRGGSWTLKHAAMEVEAGVETPRVSDVRMAEASA